MRTNTRLLSALALWACVVSPATGSASDRDASATEKPSARCTYASSSWSVRERRSVQFVRVEKARSEITPEERDPDEPRCTVCEEDQAWIRPADLGLAGVAPFRICRVFKERVESALRTIAADGRFRVITIVGYRNGRTRGPLDNGVRTLFSNHSYGTAIDVNPAQNGLYDGCDIRKVTPATIAECHLRMGGRWNPKARPATTIVANGPVTRAFESFWKWGGAIPGDLKDLMHFSITGY